MRLLYLHLHPGQAPPEPRSDPFRAIVVSEVEVEQDWRERIAEWLEKSGCLYVVAWGVECEAWHDTVDWTNLQEFGFGDIPDERFVMTTWHANQPLPEAFWFAEHCAWHPDIDLAETVILHISEEARSTEMLETYAVSQITADE